ncbi:MAG: glycosyltransferase [Candidatus Diapherotrites archaeon]
MNAVLFGRGKRGGIYYYVRELERALKEKGVHASAGWRDFPSANVLHYNFDTFGNAKQVFLLALLMLGRAAGKRVIVTSFCPTARGAKPLKSRLYERLLYKTAHKILVHDKTEWGFSYKTAAIPHGNFSFYLKHRSKQPRSMLKKKWGVSGKDVVLSYGIIRPSKGYASMLRIMRDVVRKRPNAMLLIAGQQGYASLGECGLKELPDFAVLHPKYMGEKETAELFTIADAALLTNTQNNWSGVAHVAYCFRVPVIGPDSMKSQLTITASSGREFIEKVLGILKDRPSCVREFRREMEDFSWERAAGEILAHYRG